MVCKCNACGHGGHACVGFVIGDGVHDHGSACNFDELTDGYLVADGDGSTNECSFSDGDGAAEGGAAADDDIVCDDAVVSDVNAVIHFDMVADDGGAKFGAVDGAACAEFDIIADDDGADLWDFDGVLVFGCGDEPEAIGADDGVGEELAACANGDSIGDDDAGVEDGVVADGAVGTDVDIGEQGGVGADRSVGADDAAGSDAGLGMDNSGFVDGCVGMDADGREGVAGVDCFEYADQGLVGIGDTNQGFGVWIVVFDGDGIGDERGRACAGGPVACKGIGSDKGECASLSFVDCCDGVQDDVGVADELSVNDGSELGSGD